jgi:hypothetical protein
MRRITLGIALTAGLLLARLEILGAPTGRSYSSGGSSARSFSSSRSSSSGRSYSSGSSFSRSTSSSSRSTGSSSSSGRSYSSGTSSSSRTTPFSSSSKTTGTSSSSSGKSYSSGSKSSFTPSGSRPSTGGYDSAASKAQRQAESKSAYSSRMPSPGSPSPGVPFSSSGSHSSGRSFSSGGSTDSRSSGRSYSTGGGYDRAATEAQRQAESKAAYTRGTAPRPTYTPLRGPPQKIDPTDRRVEQLRKQVDPDRWATRQARQRQTFGPPPVSPPPVVVYRDPYSSLFWLWLLQQDLDRQARWAYHHRHVMDERRYHDLLARDNRLQSRIEELEAEDLPRDPTQVPEGVDPDLVYSDEYVEAVYNPQPPPALPPRPLPETADDGGSVWMVFVVIGVIAFLIWLVFIKRWGGDDVEPEPAWKRRVRRKARR